jgi:hypothetical protein
MSGAYDEYIEMSERGLSSVPDKLVCWRHIDELFITKYIKRNSSRGVCDYCNRQAKVMALEDLMVFIMDTVGTLYTDPGNFMGYNSREGGYQGTTYDGFEILNEVFQLDFSPIAFFNDVEGSIDYGKLWADEDEYYDNQADFLSYGWNYFKKTVMHRSRYLFGNTNSLRSDDDHAKPFDILKDIGRKVRKFHLVRKVPAGTIFQRCRQHSKKDILETAAQLCSPEEQYAVNPNRMSPAGISMFYGATELETCLKETIDHSDIKKKYYTSASFRTRRELTILDLTQLPPLPSPFDERRRGDYYPLVFLREFIKDLSKPIAKDQLVHVEYVPTQIITEYFRYTFSDRKSAVNKIDGIIYPSARDKGKTACVLFMDHAESLRQLEFLPETLNRKRCKR